MLIIFSAFLAPVSLMLITYLMDWRQPEPASQLLKAFLLGGVVAILSLSFSQILVVCDLLEISNICLWSNFKHSFFGAACPEELSKLVMLWVLLYNNKYFNEFLDGIVYAVFIAMGFAVVENLCYLLTYSEVWSNTMIGRSLISVPAHFCYAVVMGICFSLWRFRNRRRALYLAFMLPMLLHGMFDFCLYAVSPKVDEVQQLSIIAFFAIWMILLLLFALEVILVAIRRDNQLRRVIEQKLWKQLSGRVYFMTGIFLTCCLVMNGEPKSSNDSSQYVLSPELSEFRDLFCLPIRNAYAQFESDGDKDAFSLSLEDALGAFNSNAYLDNQEFSMHDWRVKLCSFDNLKPVLPTASVPLFNHVIYDPYVIDSVATSMMDVEAHQGEMMYEKIHRLATDANAVSARLPLCKCQFGVLSGYAEVSFRMEQDGKRELVLVSENGGNLHLEILDKTQNKHYSSDKVDGAEWVVWTMKTHGECLIKISNPTERELSYVLASTEKQN